MTVIELHGIGDYKVSLAETMRCFHNWRLLLQKAFDRKRSLKKAAKGAENDNTWRLLCRLCDFLIDLGSLRLLGS